MPAARLHRRHRLLSQSHLKCVGAGVRRIQNHGWSNVILSELAEVVQPANLFESIVCAGSSALVSNTLRACLREQKNMKHWQNDAGQDAHAHTPYSE